MRRTSGLLARRWAILAAGSMLFLAAPRLVWAEPAQTKGIVAKGTPWETPCYVQKSDRPGPVVTITGGVHGDEPAGAVAAEQIRHWPIRCGTLAVLPRANPPSLAAKTRNMPGEPEERANLNRNFPRAGKEEPPRGPAAEKLWDWLRQQKPNWVVDLHEGYGVRGNGSQSVGSSVIAARNPQIEPAVEKMLAAVNATVEKEKQFVRLGPSADGSLARAAAEHLNAHAMTCETTSRGQPLSTRARQHRIMVHALLSHLGMLDPAFDPHALADVPEEAGKIKVALYDAGGTGGQGPNSIDRILNAGGMTVRRMGADEIASDALQKFQLVIFPGGSGSKEAAAIGEAGRKRVHDFVERGGGYVGICAGAYLCTSGYDWGLKILDAKTASPLWQRGTGEVQIELTAEGRKILGDRPGMLAVKYANGPILVPAKRDDLPDYQVLAYFRTELAKNKTPPGLMVNSPAIAAGRCGKGRVVAISPHPEQKPDLEGLVFRAALWAVGRD